MSLLRVGSGPESVILPIRSDGAEEIDLVVADILQDYRTRKRHRRDSASRIFEKTLVIRPRPLAWFCRFNSAWPNSSPRSPCSIPEESVEPYCVMRVNDRETAFACPNTSSMIAAQTLRRAPPPSSLRAGIPPAVDALCRWLVDGEPAIPPAPMEPDAPRAVKLQSYG